MEQARFPWPVSDSSNSDRPSNQANLLDELASLTSPNTYDTTYLTHGIHPYAAKFIPQLPRRILQEHTNERHRILDPFCGSGTTLLEAALLGRKSIGVDSHPVAALISKAKCTALTAQELQRARCFLERVEHLARVPNAPKAIRSNEQLRHWFAAVAIDELEYLRRCIALIRSAPLRVFLQCVYSSIIVKVSYQESETRYAAIEKVVNRGDVIERFAQKLEKALPSIESLSKLAIVRRNIPQVINSDIRLAGRADIPSEYVDLVITSPPYPNSYDYYLYHKWRLFWLGLDFRRVKEAEIGSRHEHSSQKASIDVYVQKMRSAFFTVGRALKPTKLAYVFVGDAVVDGTLYNLSDVFLDAVKGLDFQLIDQADYSLGDVSRSFREKTSQGCHGGKKHPDKRQRVLVLQRIRRKKRVLAGRTQAIAAPSRRTVHLGSIASESVVALTSNDSDRHIHSLGRYPSKFIPEIPRWAISEFSRPGETVLDPFVGSGTTAVEAVIADRNVIVSDVSPYSCLLARAKTKQLSIDAMRRCAEQLLSAIEAPSRLPSVQTPRFNLDEFWFPLTSLEQFARLRAYIETRLPDFARDFFLAVMSTNIRAASYQDEGQIKVKRDPRKVAKGVPTPFDLIRMSLPKQLGRLEDFLKQRGVKARSDVHCESADRLVPAVIQPGTIDLVVTSPPYINAMNYPMTHRYENILLGLLDPEKKTAHEAEYFGTERVYAKDFRTLEPLRLEFDRAEELTAVLAQIFREEPKRSFVAKGYFLKMYSAMGHIYNALRPDGQFVLVVGRNTIRGVPVDTFAYVVSMASALGFRLKKRFDYEIIKNAFKLTRHHTADIISLDGVAVLQKPANG